LSPNFADHDQNNAAIAARIVSINVSLIKSLQYRGKEVETGILKQPVHQPVFLRRLNLDGDRQADLRVHGGPDKAVYFYPHEHYEYWRSELQRETLPIGQFGENFTTEGLLESDVYIGNIYAIADARVQVTQPRAPCFKLSTYIQGGSGFAKTFLLSGRTGFYARVLQEGLIPPDSSITLLSEDPRRVSVEALNHLYYVDQSDTELASRALGIDALPVAWQESLKELIVGQ